MRKNDDFSWRTVSAEPVFSFYMDLSKIPSENRIRVLQKLQESQPKIIPLMSEDTKLF